MLPLPGHADLAGVQNMALLILEMFWKDQAQEKQQCV